MKSSVGSQGEGFCSSNDEDDPFLRTSKSSSPCSGNWWFKYRMIFVRGVSWDVIVCFWRFDAVRIDVSWWVEDMARKGPL